MTMDEARREVEEFGISHADFESVRHTMYRLSLHPNNKDAGLDELYHQAKEEQMASGMSAGEPTQWYTTTATSAPSNYTTAQMYQEPSMRYYHQVNEESERRAREQMERYMMDPAFLRPASLSAPTVSPEKILKLIKKSIREIKEEAVSKEAQEKVNSKVERLEKLGIAKQAAVLKAELNLRVRLARVQEWDYKVLPYDELKKFEKEHQMTATRDGIKLHIDKLEDYVGNTTIDTEKKDMIIPDSVLTDLELAKDRQVFDEFGILWVEKVKDPLLLGCINGCKDYFLIAEWGEDIKFNDIVKEEKKDGKK